MKIKDKILIVEDEQSISNFISMVLNANGYDTIIVGSGEEALTMIASHCPDLIVLDLGLPDMDGMDYAVRGDFGAAAIDYRGIVKAAGK